MFAFEETRVPGLSDHMAVYPINEYRTRIAAVRGERISTVSVWPYNPIQLQGMVLTFLLLF